MKKLSMEDMKKIAGGLLHPTCSHPSECGSGHNWDCVEGYIAYACVNGFCRVVNCDN